MKSEELQGLGVAALIHDLGKLKLPCILHWDLNHFVVLAKVGRSKVTILDPAVGERTPTTASVQRCRDQKKILPSLYTESLKNEFTQRLAGFKTSQSTPVIAAAASPLTSKRLTMVSPMATPQKTALTIRSIGWGVNSVPHTGHGAANRLAKDRLNVDGNRLPQAGHFLAVIEFPPL